MFQFFVEPGQIQGKQIFIEGKENLQKHLNTDEYSIVAIDSQGKIYKSENLKFSS